MNQDFVDLLRAFGAHDVRFLIGEAFVRNKRATGRAKALGDIEGIE